MPPQAAAVPGKDWDERAFVAEVIISGARMGSEAAGAARGDPGVPLPRGFQLPRVEGRPPGPLPAAPPAPSVRPARAHTPQEAETPVLSVGGGGLLGVMWRERLEVGSGEGKERDRV